MALIPRPVPPSDPALPRWIARLPLLFLVLCPVGCAAGVLLSFSWIGNYSPLVMYFIYAIGATIIAIGLIMMCLRTSDPHGRVAVWLVATAYTESFFALTLWSVYTLISINTFLSTGGVVSVILEAVARGAVAGSATGTAIAATVLLYGFRHGKRVLGAKIWPWPVPRRRIEKEVGEMADRSTHQDAREARQDTRGVHQSERDKAQDARGAAQDARGKRQDEEDERGQSQDQPGSES